MRDFVELGLQAGRVSDGFTNVSDILRRLGVIAPDGALTNAAAVAFYKAPSAYPGMKLGLLAETTSSTSSTSSRKACR